jgi:hypothetical protein
LKPEGIHTEDIIPAVERQILEAELNSDRFVRKANNGHNLIYIVNDDNSPNTLREIGRLREITFRLAGGGTGKDCDLDEFDLGQNAYQQLIAWDPVEKEIVGGYRFIRCADANKDAKGHPHLATSELFTFSDRFVNEYMPYTIELGRSFVQPQYQPSIDNRKGIFSLDNLWDGLGAITVDNPDIRYYFGKVTMYPHFNREARDLILRFMHHFFPDKDALVTPIRSVVPSDDSATFINEISGLEYKDAYKLLSQKVRALGEHVPPLVNAYMSLSPTMKMFGTAINEEFGEVEETGIMVTIADIYPSKKERHISTYKNS